MPGALFVVATPIGNLEDLTFRALRTLQEVDVIAAEDTRRSSKLLAHYGVSKPLISLHGHNEHREAPRLVDRMRAGASVALVSDAGTPAISDPGSLLVRQCREAGLRVVAIPGPSAITTALSVTGVQGVPFTFLGFPPASGHAREQWFESLSGLPGTVVLFEAPHRINRTIDDLACSSKRPIYVHREITKIHEELVEWHKTLETGTVSLPERGEFVLVLGPEGRAERQEEVPAVLPLYSQISAIPSLTEEQALMATAAALGLTVQKARNQIKKERILVKRQITMPADS
jgi:16S rRNA (cytidine1402-2'-O)-methyltransferase